VLGQNVKVLMPPPHAGEHDGYFHAYRTTGAAKAIGRTREVHARRKNGDRPSSAT
jgi:hypothetical protein